MILTRGLEPPEVLMSGGPTASGDPEHIMSSDDRATRFLEALAPRATIHGVLSTCSGRAALIGHGVVGERRWSSSEGHRLVADDVVQVVVRPDTVWGAHGSASVPHGIRGMGIFNITHLFGVGAVRDTKKVEVVVELSDLHEDDYDCWIESSTWPILGIDVPLVRIPLRAGRNIAQAIEVVARNQCSSCGDDSARVQDMVSRIAAATAPTVSWNERARRHGDDGAELVVVRARAARARHRAQRPRGPWILPCR